MEDNNTQAQADVANAMPDAIDNDVLANIGLTSAEVAGRIAEGKVNGMQTIRTKSYAQIFISNIFTFFNFLFIALAIILSFFVRFDSDNFADGIGNFGFVILVFLNSSISIIQELNAKHTIDKLSLISAPKVKVLRNGEETEIMVKDIVLDDITILSSGGQICADSVVVEGCIEVNESLITGEPDAIVKNVGDEIMSGSFVVSGKARAKVIHVGMDNFAMKISAGAKYFKKPSSDILRSLNKVVKVMAILIVPLGISLFCIKYLVQPGELNVTVINTIGTLIGMIPSGLVALSSAVFCISVIRLAKHKTLAQDMYCVETLARVDVLCLDKTGTITEGTMEVNSISPKAGGDENEIKQILKNFTEALAENNATANAIGDYVKDCASNASTTEIVPFSSARKWSGAYLNGRSYVLGAPEFVFTALPKEITSVTETMAEKGFRVLVLASSPNHFEGSNIPDDLTLESFVFITDKIRAEAPDTLRFFREQGVNVKIISGDNPATVRAVALRAGLEDCDNFIDMSTLKTDEEVIAAADKYTIFGRVLPDQKLLIIKSLKAAGHTVAMTGDGVNDVLALKAADCSIAMA
ncbi:MAG: HAD-IC family P-type ATPase, partial [Clostridia bacterium]